MFIQTRYECLVFANHRSSAWDSLNFNKSAVPCGLQSELDFPLNEVKVEDEEHARA